MGIPEKIVLEVPLMLQSYDLTCEAISAAMIAEYYEYELPDANDSDQEYQSWEDYFMKVIEPDPNPHLGFRGDIYGRMSTYDNVEGYGYGVYAEPIHKALTEVGYDAEVKYGVDYDDIENDLRSGNPVILWVSSQRTPAETVQIEDKDVRLIYGEHAWVVLGVQGYGNNRKFLVNHSVYNKQYWKRDFIRWGDFQNEDGVGGMRVIVRS
ncbi:MAG: hypothetical protein GY760_25270 [Deltaproteobacteria bacterium]|nr:hypothetical protein [Deltaproteobacteria bacterium]